MEGLVRHLVNVFDRPERFGEQSDLEHGASFDAPGGPWGRARGQPYPEQSNDEGTGRSHAQ